MVHGPLILAAGSLLDATPHDLVEAASRAGFDGVGLCSSGEHRVADPETFRHRAKEIGIQIHDVEVSHRRTGGSHSRVDRSRGRRRSGPTSDRL
ncbi:hypothetical protein [Ilumatobacter sp.]|uniref:hypothetical protein n=1 Tax=Ilumatobacter sp. TaxID=1967498 RepID=UPI003753D145